MAALLALTAPGLCAAQNAPVAPGDLDEALAFTDPAHCAMGEPLQRILASLRAVHPETWQPVAGPAVTIPGRPEPLRPVLHSRFAVGRDAMGWVTEADMELRGRWLGLQVVGLRGNAYSDGIMIRFAETPERVHATLARVGFRLPRVGQWRFPDYGKPDPGPTTSVRAEGAGAVFYCEASPIP